MMDERLISAKAKLERAIALLDEAASDISSVNSHGVD
ncbi:MAG: hypothetical protein ACI9R3_001175 [Verrucomicrobiales bacterium]|jgi:hypothetical protein